MSKHSGAIKKNHISEFSMWSQFNCKCKRVTQIVGMEHVFFFLMFLVTFEILECQLWYAFARVIKEYIDQTAIAVCENWHDNHHDYQQLFSYWKCISLAVRACTRNQRVCDMQMGDSEFIHIAWKRKISSLLLSLSSFFIVVVVRTANEVDFRWFEEKKKHSLKRKRNDVSKIALKMP